MHYLPLIVFLLTLKLSLICALGGPRNLLAFVKDCLTVGEDYWTWTTRAGECFEDAEVEAIEDGELVLKHRYGVVRLAIDRLSEKSRYLLFRTQKWADHVGHNRAADTNAAYASESSFAQTA